MEQVLVFSLTAMANPTLVAVMAVMLLLPRPEKLMLAYYLGGMVTSITLGLVIVFALQGSGVFKTTKHTINPLVDLALGAIFLLISVVVGTGEYARVEERRAERKGPKKDKGPPSWQRALDKGSFRIAFAVGAVLSLPGASYRAALDGVVKLKAGTTITILVVLFVNLIQFALLEVVLIAFAVAPDWTPKAVERSKRWFAREAHRIVVIGIAIVGLLLVTRGVIELLS